VKQHGTTIGGLSGTLLVVGVTLSRVNILRRWSWRLSPRRPGCSGSRHHAAELLAEYAAKAGAPAQPERGQRFFNTGFGREFGWSCASCHGAVPTRPVPTN